MKICGLEISNTTMLWLLEIPSEILTHILERCTVSDLPFLAITSKVIKGASDERRDKILVLRKNPFNMLFGGEVLNLGILILSNKRIGERVESFADACASGALPLLSYLYLEGNEIGDTGCTYLAEACTTGALEKLKCLDLDDNQIGDRGISDLASACARGALPSLTSIYLNTNQIGDAGVSSFANTFVKGSLQNLKYLDVGNNQIGDAGMSALVSTCVNSARLKVSLSPQSSNPSL